MLDFKLPDMTCGHCVRAVQQAIHQADPEARVDVDLPSQQVHVETPRPRDEIAAALAEAGYPPA